jgi:hypothetical protein
MHQPCPHCDQPDSSLLRLMLLGEILRANEQPGAAIPLSLDMGVKAPTCVSTHSGTCRSWAFCRRQTGAGAQRHRFVCPLFST